MDLTKGNQTVIVYDGECPVCSRYVSYLRLADAVGEPKLIDARQNAEVVAALSQEGINLDYGMIFMLNGRIYAGADAIHAMALCSTRSTTFNKINAWVFQSPRVSRALYPTLRFLRNLLLVILGKKKING